MASGISSPGNVELNNDTSKNYTSALIMLTSLFFMWGFITCLNDILIPHLKALFDLNYTQTMLIQFTFFGAYALMSVPAGIIIGKIGYQRGIVLGLFVAGLGALMFYPASTVISYGLFLAGLFVLASGITILQVSANPYVSILGSSKTASARLNLTQALNSFGTTIAPVFGAMLILNELVTDQTEKAASVQGPYVGIAVTLFVIAILFIFAKLPVIEPETYKEDAGNAWQFKHLVLGAVAIFVYVGAEVSIGSFLVNFFGEPEIGGLKEEVAAKYMALYWGGAMIGRFFGAVSLSNIVGQRRAIYYGLIFTFSFFLAWWLTEEMQLAAIFLIFVTINVIAFNLGQKLPARTLAIFSGIVILLVIITVSSTGPVAMWPIVAVGLFNSIMFPTIFTLAIDGLGRHTSQGSGILCMAIVGGAIIPLLMGVMADNFGIQNSFLITIVCYAYILFYGVKGYKHSIK